MNTLHVENVSGGRVFIAGYGVLDPMDPQALSDSPQVQELVAIGCLRAATVDGPADPAAPDQPAVTPPADDLPAAPDAAPDPGLVTDGATDTAAASEEPAPIKRQRPRRPARKED